MILWYYQIRPKVVWKVHGAWTKTLPLQKVRVYHSKNHVIPHSVIADILNVILNFLQR